MSVYVEIKTDILQSDMSLLTFNFVITQVYE